MRDSAQMEPILLYVIGSLDVGGAERHLSQLLPRLKARGFHPCVFTLTEKGQLASGLEAQGIPVLTAPKLAFAPLLPNSMRRLVRALLGAIGLISYLLRRRPAAVHCFLPEAYLVGGLCTWLLRLSPRLMSRRSLNDYQRKRPLLARLERWLHSRMQAVSGNSRAVLEELRAEGVEDHKLHLIYNGVDLEEFDRCTAHGDSRVDIGAADGDWILIHVANLLPYKGHADLLDGLASVQDRLPPNWRLWCIGRDLGLGEELSARAQALGIGAQVSFLGQRHDVARLLSLADVAVLCSHEEGFSNALLEAMAAGLPVIATAVGGNTEAVIDGVTGLTVPPHDPAALGEAIARLNASANEAKRMGAAGRQRIGHVFSIQMTLTAYERLYRSLLGTGE